MVERDFSKLDAVKEDDALWFLRYKNKEEEGVAQFAKVTDKFVPKLDVKAEYYSMSGPTLKGLALIFNHYDFKSNNTKREGTKKDCEDLQNVLMELRFDVAVYQDLTKEKIFEVIDRVSESDLREYDCLVVTVMSHGAKDKIYTYDSYYTPEDLWIRFSAENCSTLIGKPKFFFIQACRGTKLDSGSRLKRSVSYQKPAEPEYKIPNMADILIMYSTYSDHYSWRSGKQGSWFIQCLIKEMWARAERQDLLSILTAANRRMAFNYTSFIPHNKGFHEKKQVGMIVSTLTKKFYFHNRSQKEYGKEKSKL